MNFWTLRSPYLESPAISRFSALTRRLMSSSLLGPLGPVLGAPLLAVLHPRGVERAADDVVAHAGQVLHPSAADQHDGMLLQVVPLARDVGRDLVAVREPHAGHLAKSRVGLLRRGRIDARADPSPLRTIGEGRCRGLLTDLLASLADELVDRRHETPISNGQGPAPRRSGEKRHRLTKIREMAPQSRRRKPHPTLPEPLTNIPAAAPRGPTGGGIRPQTD